MGELQRRARHGAPAIVGAVALLVLSACGAQHGGPPSARISAAGGQVAAAPSAPATDAATAPGANPAATAVALDHKLAAAERRARRLEAHRAARTIAAERRTAAHRAALHEAAVTRSTAESLALAMGYTQPLAVVSDGARTIVVTVGVDGACGAPSTGSASYASRLRAALPYLHDVSVLVSGISLGSFAAGSCAWAHLPAADTVASQTGSGTGELAPFRVGRGTWEVDYGTSGSFLEVLVLQDAQILAVSATRAGAGAGRTTFSGPGTFTLRVAGDGRWAVQVRRAAR